MPIRTSSSLGSLVIQSSNSQGEEQRGSRARNEEPPSQTDRGQRQQTAPSLQMSPLRPGAVNRSQTTLASRSDRQPIFRLSKLIDSKHPNWMPDSLSDVCQACRRTFSVLRRRHHCRSCGSLCCAKCGEYRTVYVVERSSKWATGSTDVHESYSVGRRGSQEAFELGNPRINEKTCDENCSKTADNPHPRTLSQGSSHHDDTDRNAVDTGRRKAVEQSTEQGLEIPCNVYSRITHPRCRSVESDGSSETLVSDQDSITVGGKSHISDKNGISRVRVCLICVNARMKDDNNVGLQELERLDESSESNDSPFGRANSARPRTADNFFKAPQVPFTPPEGAQQINDEDHKLPTLRVDTSPAGAFGSCSIPVPLSDGAGGRRTPNRNIRRQGVAKGRNRSNRRLFDMTDEDTDISHLLAGEDFDEFQFDRQRSINRALLNAAHSRPYGEDHHSSSSSEGVTEVTECANCGRQFLYGPGGMNSSLNGEFCTRECFVSKALATGRYGLLA